MAQLAERNDNPALSANVWLHDALSPFDVLAVLSDALSPAWSVEREVDPGGDISIVVLPARDDPRRTAFVLYEDNGFAQVATVRGDRWQCRRAFPTCQRAVASIITLARSEELANNRCEINE